MRFGPSSGFAAALLYCAVGRSGAADIVIGVLLPAAESTSAAPVADILPYALQLFENDANAIPELVASLGGDRLRTVILNGGGDGADAANVAVSSLLGVNNGRRCDTSA